MSRYPEHAKTILVVGATSAIAHATAQLYAAEGYRIHLMARNHEKLNRVAEDLRTRGASDVTVSSFDATDPDTFPPAIEDAQQSLGELGIGLIAHGDLPDQSVCQHDTDATARAIMVNYTSAVMLITLIANVMERQGRGSIVAISSVAGDRGRPSNYVYGSAKAGLNTFLEGLRISLLDKGVHVLTIKPGLVDTPMTAHIHAKGKLWVPPQTIAATISRAIARHRRSLYAPAFWRAAMLIVRAAPRILIRRANL